MDCRNCMKYFNCGVALLDDSLKLATGLASASPNSPFVSSIPIRAVWHQGKGCYMIGCVKHAPDSGG
jgi:hypothetical protein